jgi:DNA replicative helicase MCM subunit Mcm2 (Cdc46/Mcm family)
MSDPNKEYIETKKSKSKKDKAKIELAEKMAKRKKTSPSDTLQTIKIQERFDKDPVSRKTDMIGDDKLTTDFAKGGRVNFRGGGICKKGINKKAYGRNS